jgi:hypothetical protein
MRLLGCHHLIDQFTFQTIDMCYDWIDYFQGGRAVAAKDGKYGVVSNDGAMVIPCWYDDVEGDADGGYTGYIITPKGTQICRFDRAGNQIDENMKGG